jgi:hypothetical protein
MRKATGLAAADAADDFIRARRRQVLARLGSWLRREPDDVNMMLPFNEVVKALGRAGETYLGQQTIPLDAIVGSVDRARDFDRRFRPTSNRARGRWERIDVAHRKGEAMPPIEAYRVGDLYFVKDGHHRVSVAHSLGLDVIEGYVTEILTRGTVEGLVTPGDIVTKDYERIFRLRVPLTPEMSARIQVTDPWGYAELAENVEAWGFRLVQDGGEFVARPDIARRWFEEEFEPVTRMLREADLIGHGTDADAYLRFARERYRLIRTHEWSEDVIERLKEPP